MSEDLQIAALHSDNALLDALGGRVPGSSLGVVAGVEPRVEGDIAARLLAAFAEEIDTRPGPLTELLTRSLPGVTAADRSLTVLGVESTDVDSIEAVPFGADPLDVLVPITHARRRRRLAMPRTAAILTTGALVLGFGGAAAALHGNAGPLENLRRAVDSVTGSPSAAARTPAERAQRLLASAEEAMNNGDMNAAAARLAEVQRLLPLIADPDVVGTLRADLDALRKRWAAIAPALTAAVTHSGGKVTPTTVGTPVGTSGPRATYSPPANSGPVPQTLVPGTNVVTDPTENLPSVNNSPVGSAKNDLKDKAKQKLGHPLPSQAPLPPRSQSIPAPNELPAPVGGMRGPTGSPLSRELPAWSLLYNYGGDALSKPDPASLAGALAKGNGKH